MAKVIVLCGKICSGKSTYAEKMRRETRAVLFSIDEITLALFGQQPGEQLDQYVEALEKYLFEKAVETVQNGINVILDIGLWTKRKRLDAKAFFREKKVACEIHCLDIDDEEWKKRIRKRNDDIKSGKISAYYVDENLMRKADALFERPDREEVDVWVDC